MDDAEAAGPCATLWPAATAIDTAQDGRPASATTTRTVLPSVTDDAFWTTSTR